MGFFQSPYRIDRTHCQSLRNCNDGPARDQRGHSTANAQKWQLLDKRVMLSVPRDLKRVVETKQEGSYPAPNSKYHNRNKSLYTLVTEMELKFALVIRQFYQCQSEIPIANKDTTCQPIFSWSQTTL